MPAADGGPTAEESVRAEELLALVADADRARGDALAAGDLVAADWAEERAAAAWRELWGPPCDPVTGKRPGEP